MEILTLSKFLLFKLTFSRLKCFTVDEKYELTAKLVKVSRLRSTSN